LNLEAYALPREYSLEKIDLIEAEPEGKSGIDTVFHEELSPWNERADYTTEVRPGKQVVHSLS